MITKLIRYAAFLTLLLTTLLFFFDDYDPGRFLVGILLIFATGDIFVEILEERKRY